MNRRSLRVLVAEDNLDDLELLRMALERQGYALTLRHVMDDPAFRRALVEEEWDFIFCDWAIPGFGAPQALETLKESRRQIPFVIVSGTIDEETAVSAMRAGADDFLLKTNLARLSGIMERELAQSAERVRHREAQRALAAQEAIVTAVGNAAERLIRSPGWEDAIREVLACTGEATGASHILIYQNRAVRRGREGVLRLAWTVESTTPAVADGLGKIRWVELAPAWSLAVAGGGVSFSVGDPRFQAPAWRWMARHDVRSLCLVPIRIGKAWWGAITMLDRRARTWSHGEISALRVLGDALGASIERSELHSALTRSHSDLAEAYNHTLEGWALALELRDRETAGHTRRVAEMTMRLARSMGIEQEHLLHVRRGALLHDIGKMGVPDSILLKPGPLDDKEREVMRLHPVYAYELLQGIPYLHPALDIPYAHHERWDGTGYPRGLAGEEIPLAARIFAAVDAWDAMRTDRPYRKAMPRDAALSEIEAGAGSHFDPRVVEAFLAMMVGRKSSPIEEDRERRD